VAPIVAVPVEELVVEEAVVLLPMRLGAEAKRGGRREQIGPVLVVPEHATRLSEAVQAAILVPMTKRRGPDIRKRFGFAAKDRREALGWTKEEFAEREASIGPT
jgi:hypothetical protein